MSFRLHYAPDNASMIVRIVLNELDLDYEACLVDRSAQAQKSAAYRAVNPIGRIPALETESGTIFETAAIILWLADREKQLAPALNDPERGRFLTWLFFLSNTLHAELRLLFYPHTYAAAAPDALRDCVKANLKGHVGHLEALASEGWAFFGADTPSLLDIYVCACLRWMTIYPPHEPEWWSLADFPNLQSIALRCESRPSALAVVRAEGLGATPFSAASLPNPPEGRAI